MLLSSAPFFWGGGVEANYLPVNELGGPRRAIFGGHPPGSECQKTCEGLQGRQGWHRALRG